MQTELEQVQKTEACADPACADDCCAERPGFAKAYWIGIGALGGLIAVASLVSALLN